MEDVIVLWVNVPPKTMVANGYNYSESPKNGKYWTLEQVYNPKDNTHIRFEWRKQSGFIDDPLHTY
jgi:hypothetical protein